MTSSKNVRQILVIKPSSLGDILHVFPALQLLKQYFPQAELDFLVNPEFAPLLDFSPFAVRERIIFERKKLASARTAPPEFFKLLKSLRKRQYDLVIDFQGLLRSALVARMASCTKGGIYGFASPREPLARLFYSHHAVTQAVHAVEKNVELVNRVTGYTDIPPVPDVPAAFNCQDFIDKLPERFILLMPGARWESKCFPVELFAETAKNIHKATPSLHFIIAGSKAEIPAAQKLSELLPEKFPVLDYTGQTSLPELFELIRHAQAVVCNDSGPMHIAALMQVPVFAFFGPTNPDKTGPWKQRSNVFSNNVSCSGCMNRKCPKSETICHQIDPIQISTAVFQQIFKKETL